MPKTNVQYWPEDQAKALMYLDSKQLRQMYTQYRDIAHKRLSRLRESEFDWTRAVKDHPQDFPKLRDIEDRDLPKAFSQLSKFVNAKLSTISGQRSRREKTIAKWRENGLDLDRTNYETVMKIMEQMRRNKLLYGSDKAVGVADKMLEMDASVRNDLMDDMKTILENSEEFMSLDVPAQSGYSADDILSMLG